MFEKNFIVIIRQSMCERTPMCPFCESTVLSYCKYHTKRTWKYVAGKAFRFAFEPAWHTIRTHTLERRERMRENEKETFERCISAKWIEVVDSALYGSWTCTTLIHTTIQTEMKEKEKENGSRKPWRLKRWKGKWKCSQNTLALLMKWHTYKYACTYARTRWQSVSAGRSSSRRGTQVTM